MTRADKIEAALRELVAALDQTAWSSWQTLARFSPAWEAARAALALPPDAPAAQKEIE